MCNPFVISVHTNWDPAGEVLPPEEGCPGVQFTEDNFVIAGNQWICLDTSDNGKLICVGFLFNFYDYVKPEHCTYTKQLIYLFKVLRALQF